jgi:dTMP kinase
VLIAIEGIDGSGKSTLAAGIARAFESRGRRVRVVSRYMITEISSLWWTVLDNDFVDQRAAALLAAADCAIAALRIVRPALDSGDVVVSDRYVYSHMAHFGARQVPLEPLKTAFAQAVVPDVVVKLEIDPHLALERLRMAGKPDFWEAGLDHQPELSIGGALRRHRSTPPARERMEACYLEHQARIEQSFEAALPGEITARLDATQSIEAVRAACLALPALRTALEARV